MKLQLTDEQKAIADALKDFATNEMRPAARDCEAAGETAERLEKQLFEMGVSAPVPEEFGGQGTFDAVTSVIIAEELAWGDPAIAFSALGHGLPATLIDMAGTDDQRARMLPKFADGMKGALGIAELDAGADFTLTECVASDDDAIRISGRKYLVPLPEGDFLFLAVACRNDSVGLFSVDPEGIVATPEDKLGLRGARTFKIEMEGTGAAEVIGDSDARRIELALLRAKLLNAGIALGLARAAHDYASQYARERTAFGRPIGAFQGIAFKVADRAMDIDTARLLVWRAASAVDKAEADAARLVMSACAQAMIAAVQNADDGVQILGGHGYMQDHPEEMWYRDAMTLAAVDSPSLIGDAFLAQTYKGESQ